LGASASLPAEGVGYFVEALLFPGKPVLWRVSRPDKTYFFSGSWRAGEAGRAKGEEERFRLVGLSPTLPVAPAGRRRSQGGWERRHLAGKGV